MYCWITGAVEIRILDAYWNRFTADQRTADNLNKGRVWQRFTKEGRPFNNGMIGKNYLSKYGVVLAGAIGIDSEQAKKYTGHCARRGAATDGANTGMNNQELQALTGHKSERTLRMYIDQSEVTLNRNANAMTVGGGPCPGVPAVLSRTFADRGSPDRVERSIRPRRSPGSFFDSAGFNLTGATNVHITYQTFTEGSSFSGSLFNNEKK